jgi:hypothetical protein
MMGPSYLNFKPPRRTGFILKPFPFAKSKLGTHRYFLQYVHHTTCDGSCINVTQSLRSVLISVVFKAPKEVK